MRWSGATTRTARTAWAIGAGATGAPAPLLDAAGRAALTAALARPSPDGGLWTGAKVAAWIAGHTGRERVAPQRGWDDLRRTGHSR